MRTLVWIHPVLTFSEDVDVSSLLQLKADGRELQSVDSDCKQGPELCKKKPPTCAGYSCPTGWDRITTAVTCGTSCSTDQCCVSTTTTTQPPTCDDYKNKGGVCPLGMVYDMTGDSDDEPCDNKFACMRQCCVKKPPTCSDFEHKCPQGFDFNSDNKMEECSGMQCVKTCCTKKTTPTCSDYEQECPRGFEFDTTLKMDQCGGKLQCLTKCCKRPKPTCADYEQECPGGMEFDTSKKMDQCGGKLQCLKTCCKRPTPTCADFEQKCPSGFEFNPQNKMKKCSRALECAKTCCKPKTPTCADFEQKCPRGFEFDSMSKMKKCSGASQCAKTCCKKLPTCADYEKQCPRGMVYNSMSSSKTCSNRMSCVQDCCMTTTTTTTTKAPTTTPSFDEREEPPPSAPVQECRLFGDPEIHSFDGISDKDSLFRQKGLSTSHMDFYKEGQFWLVNGPNIKIQGEFTKIGQLSKSSMTKVAISGRACGGKVLQLVRGSQRDQTKTLLLDGRPITSWSGNSRDGYSYEDGTFTITKTMDRSGYDYLIKFDNDKTVEIFYEPKFFSNVPGGMQDVDIMMKKRNGVIGLCGVMGRKEDGIKYMIDLKSEVKAGESLFGGTIPVRNVPQQQCPPMTKRRGEQFCLREVCQGDRGKCVGDKNFKDCCFDYCNGGEQVARANLGFQRKADQVRAVETGQSTGTTESWLNQLTRLGGSRNGFGGFGGFRRR